MQGYVYRNQFIGWEDRYMCSVIRNILGDICYHFFTPFQTNGGADKKIKTNGGEKLGGKLSLWSFICNLLCVCGDLVFPEF